jgi:hypothetical protein
VLCSKSKTSLECGDRSPLFPLGTMSRKTDLRDRHRTWLSTTRTLVRAASPSAKVERLALHQGQRVIVSEAKRFNVVACGSRFGKSCWESIGPSRPHSKGTQ